MARTWISLGLVTLLAADSGSFVCAETFDHSAWNRILKTAVTDDGWVDYKAIESKWRKELSSYLASLESASLESLEDASERKAFWINAYNALTIQKLIDAKLPKQVPNAAIFGKNIFEERTYRVAGKLRSLDDIEHGILRKSDPDPRIHAALVCGASSCPRLRREAYRGKVLDRQLDEEARYWVQRGRSLGGQRKNRLDRDKKIYHVSKIFDWYEGDFGGGRKGVLRFLGRYGSAGDREFLEKNGVTIRYLTYDWKLNRQAARGK